MWTVSAHPVITLGLLLASIPYAAPCEEEFQAEEHWQYYSTTHGDPSECDLQFWAKHGFAAEVEVTRLSMPGRVYGKCMEAKVTMYNGITTYDGKVHMLCGQETGSVTTGSGRAILVQYRGFGYGNRIELRYRAVDRPTTYNSLQLTLCDQETGTVKSLGRAALVQYAGFGYGNKIELRYRAVDYSYRTSFDSYEPLGAGAIFGLCMIPVVLVAFLTCVCCYSCKAYKRTKSRLELHGYTLNDIRVTRITMVTQAREGTLTRISSKGRAVPVRLNRLNQALNTWVKVCPVPASHSDALLARVQQNMDFFRAQRLGMTPEQQESLTAASMAAIGQGQGHNRVRHPAGDVHHDEIQLNDYSSPPHPPHPHMGGAAASHSNNNVLTNNNTAANLNYPGQNGSSYFPYAGQPSSSSSSTHLHHPHHHEHDHHGIRGGGGGGSGRSSPHHYPGGASGGNNTNSLGRRSPRHNYHPQPPAGDGVLTYYGNIEGRGSSSALPTAPLAAESTDAFLGPRGNSNASQGHDPNEPPPSYEEITAGGKLAPPYNKPM